MFKNFNRDEAPRSLLRGIKRNSPKPPTLLRQGFGGFSAPLSPQQTAEHSATENKLLAVFLFVLLCLDFFGIGNLQATCRSHQGSQFNHPVNFTLVQLDHYRFGAARVSYNFAHFFIFWAQVPLGKTLNSVKDFLSLDGVAGQPSPLPWNIAHFFAFLIFVLVLLRFFRLKWYWVLIIAVFFNIFHEYISEGLCADPSFNDLWVDMLGTLVGLLIWQIILAIKLYQTQDKKRF